MKTLPYRFATAVFTAFSFMASLYSMWVLGPYVEELVAGPVASKMRIISAEEWGSGTAIKFEFEKLRACEWLGMSWYVRKAPDAPFERVPVTLASPGPDVSDRTRPLGRQIAGPWVVAAPKDATINRSFARLRHRCHGLWVSTTDFYP